MFNRFYKFLAAVFAEAIRMMLLVCLFRRPGQTYRRNVRSMRSGLLSDTPFPIYFAFTLAVSSCSPPVLMLL